MAEESEGSDAGAAASGAGVDPAAVALALNGASRERADAFLKKQEALIEDQRHHLRRQFTALELNIWQQRLGVLLRIATGFVGIIVAAGLAYMIWDASQSSGLLIEPFSVPPDLAARGMTGEVVAAKLLDHLSEMQAKSVGLNEPKSYANDWGQAGIKLDIPETGVSLTELDDFLRAKLGHDTHITGEIVRTASGVSLTARTGTEGVESVSGSDVDLDGLVFQLSEAVYRLTQTHRYASYLVSQNRFLEAISVNKGLAETGTTRLDRNDGNTGWAEIAGEQDDIETEIRVLQRAIAAEPDSVNAPYLLAMAETARSLPEQAIHDYEKSLVLLPIDKLKQFSVAAASISKLLHQADIDLQFGDFHDAGPLFTAYSQGGGSNGILSSARLAVSKALEHDSSGARATLLDMTNYRLGNAEPGHATIWSLKARLLIDTDVEHWSDVISDANAIAPQLPKYPGLRTYLPTMTVPLTAYAEAGLGKIADAGAHIAATPADCYDCLIARARIAELEGQHARADWWFARAIDGQKSIPFAYYYWGDALLDRGGPDAAIAKFTLANQKGPKFADPLEGWGEALMAKNRSDLALAKFTDAEKYAPNWGRLHLKWGEALGFAGRKDEAQKQFALAGGLDLSSADKAELAKVRG